jgi:hypothetical protein
MPTQQEAESLSQEEITAPYQNHRTAFLWKDAYKEAGWIFLISRLILLVITYIGPSQFIQQGTQQGTFIAPHECAFNLKHCLLSWDFWDVGVFVDIAHSGYAHRPPNQYNLSAFFPLWPLIMHILGGSLSSSFTSLFFTGLVLANVCFYFGLVLLYYLVDTQFGPMVARDTLFFLAMGPYALFFFIGYSESLFLLLCLAMFFFLYRGRSLDWWLAGLCGFLAALTRPTGIVLTIPFLATLVQRFWPYWTSLRTHWRLQLNATLPLLLIPLGLLLYMIYLYIVMGDPLAFSHWEAATWGRHLTFPWMGIINDLHYLFRLTKNFTYNLMDLLFTLIPLTALLISWKRLPLHYNLFTLVTILFSLSNPRDDFPRPLSSSPRFMLVIFPVFIIFALWGQHPRIRSILMALSVSLFTINALLFLSHGWVA